ncbi:MAG: hypothetical protein R2787_05670 [Saprospiraceae bacterium]
MNNLEPILQPGSPDLFQKVQQRARRIQKIDMNPLTPFRSPGLQKLPCGKQNFLEMVPRRALQ